MSVTTATESDFGMLARMHIDPSTERARNLDKDAQYRFFFDKVKLFHEFDAESILLHHSIDGDIDGFLFYSRDEPEFNSFTGPSHASFYARALKTALGFYGFDFKKYIAAAKSTTGHAETDVEVSREHYAKIWVLIVAHEARRQGIAHTLIEDCITRLEERRVPFVHVTVRTDNDAAIGSYEKSGFTVIGTCEESSGTSYIMERQLQF
jgi:ribosomal protein S18 acetylase RimI-like enzyme